MSIFGPVNIKTIELFGVETPGLVTFELSYDTASGVITATGFWPAHTVEGAPLKKLTRGVFGIGEVVGGQNPFDGLDAEGCLQVGSQIFDVPLASSNIGGQVVVNFQGETGKQYAVFAAASAA